MSANDVNSIISEVVQGLLGLGALAGIILFQLKGLPVPDLLWLLLGAILIAFGIKIGLPLQPSETATALPATLAVTTPTAQATATLAAPAPALPDAPVPGNAG